MQQFSDVGSNLIPTLTCILSPFHTRWRLPATGREQPKSPLITGSCLITACRYRPAEMKKYFHCRHQINCCPVVDNSWGTVECTSRITNMQKKITPELQTNLNYLSTVGRQIETVTVKWRVLETMGRQIMMSLPQHLNKKSLSAISTTRWLTLLHRSVLLSHVCRLLSPILVTLR